MLFCYFLSILAFQKESMIMFQAELYVFIQMILLKSLFFFAAFLFFSYLFGTLSSGHMCRSADLCPALVSIWEGLFLLINTLFEHCFPCAMFSCIICLAGCHRLCHTNERTDSRSRGGRSTRMIDSCH